MTSVPVETYDRNQWYGFLMGHVLAK